jgi:hypothetical protein
LQISNIGVFENSQQPLISIAEKYGSMLFNEHSPATFTAIIKNTTLGILYYLKHDFADVHAGLHQAVCLRSLR